MLLDSCAPVMMKLLLLVVAMAGFSLVMAKEDDARRETRGHGLEGSPVDDFAFNNYLLNHPDMQDWRSMFSKRFGSQGRLGDSKLADLMQNWSQTFSRNARSFGGSKGFSDPGNFGKDRYQNWNTILGKRFARNSLKDTQS